MCHRCTFFWSQFSIFFNFFFQFLLLVVRIWALLPWNSRGKVLSRPQGPHAAIGHCNAWKVSCGKGISQVRNASVHSWAYSKPGTCITRMNATKADILSEFIALKKMALCKIRGIVRILASVCLVILSSSSSFFLHRVCPSSKSAFKFHLNYSSHVHIDFCYFLTEYRIFGVARAWPAWHGGSFTGYCLNVQSLSPSASVVMGVTHQSSRLAVCSCRPHSKCAHTFRVYNQAMR